MYMKLCKYMLLKGAPQPSSKTVLFNKVMGSAIPESLFFHYQED